jgi:hypothetical protein
LSARDERCGVIRLAAVRLEDETGSAHGLRLDAVEHLDAVIDWHAGWIVELQRNRRQAGAGGQLALIHLVQRITSAVDGSERIERHAGRQIMDHDEQRT